MEDKDQLTVMKLSAVLFDQRSDSFGEGKHKGPHTMRELKQSTKTATGLRNQRRKQIAKKKEKWSKDASERRLEIRRELKNKEQKKFDDRIEQERLKNAEVERKRLAEIERIRIDEMNRKRKQMEALHLVSSGGTI